MAIEFHPDLRIRSKFAAQKVVEQVLPDQQKQEDITTVLAELGNKGTIELGGRRLRDLLGCQTMDVAARVDWDAAGLTDHQRIRLGIPTQSLLLEYPGERLAKPDVDIFTSGIDQKEIRRALLAKGIKSRSALASGGVKVTWIESDKGNITFTDSKQSWQTSEPWPMYAARAKLNPTAGTFDVDIAYDRLNTYPLEIPGIQLCPADNPRRFAAVARAALWAWYSTTPDGTLLAYTNNSELNERCMVETMELAYPIISGVAKGFIKKEVYGCGLRDMALAYMAYGMREQGISIIDKLSGAFLRGRFK